MPVLRQLLDPGVALAMMTLYMGAVAAAGMFLIVVAIEAVVLVLLKWGSVLRSVLVSALMNMFSLAAGIAIFALVIYFDLARDLQMLLRNLPGGAILWIGAWVVSVLTEGVFLQVARGRANQPRESWIASLAANVSSYGLLLGLLALLILG